MSFCFYSQSESILEYRASNLSLECINYSQVIGSYNGGKDAVVIMHLMRAAHAAHHRNFASKNSSPPRPKVIYFESKNEFPEVLTLLHQTVDEFDLQMIAFDDTHSFSDGLNVIVKKNSGPMAFVLGTRKDDPNSGSQGLFAPSSDWMPPFMRVNPALHWSYGQVWHFLRLFELPYCSLYDEGYTSLGTIKDTTPCPALARPNGGFWPAYMLREFDQERAGRLSKKKTSLKVSPSTIKLDDTNKEPPTPDFRVETPSISTTSSQRQKTVGLIIIGDEILKGCCTDTNTHAAALALREHNVPLARISVVSDDHDQIVNEIHRMHRQVDIIVTSGGVGPTHDDVTMKSVSTALSSPLKVHEEMASLLLRKMNNDTEEDVTSLTEAQMKMATLPQNSKLKYLAGKEEWPILQCRNIFVLPGVPQFFAAKIELVAAHLSAELDRSEHYKVVLRVDESSIVDALNKVVTNHPTVSFGSYPFIGHPNFKTVITIEGKDSHDNIDYRKYKKSHGNDIPKSVDTSKVDKDVYYTKEEMDLHVKLALEELVEELPEGSILRVDTDENLEAIEVTK